MSLSRHISRRGAIGYLLIVALICIPIKIYCDHRLLLGDLPAMKLLAIAGIGGAILFALTVDGSHRLAAFVSGGVAGVGEVSIYIHFLGPLDRCPDLSSRNSAMLILMGTAPGFFLFWLLLWLSEKGDSKTD